MAMLLGPRRALLSAGKLINALYLPRINSGSDAAIDDLHDAQLTAEAWVRGHTLVQSDFLVDKGFNAEGWLFWIEASNIASRIYCATTNAHAYGTIGDLKLGIWHHIAMTWDDASYNHPRLWVDGEETTDSTGNRVGAITSDAANDLIIGYQSTYRFDGDMSWFRLSDTIRYTGAFTPPSQLNPPAVDGNTVLQYNFTEGVGTTLDNAEGTATLDGAITNPTWIKVKI